MILLEDYNDISKYIEVKKIYNGSRTKLYSAYSQWQQYEIVLSISFFTPGCREILMTDIVQEFCIILTITERSSQQCLT